MQEPWPRSYHSGDGKHFERFVVIVLCTIVVVSCARAPRETPFDARKFDGAQVVVEVSGSSTECKVSIRSEKVGRVVACGRLVEYFGDQLHLRPGTKYYFVDSGNSHRGEINALVSAMKASGYPPVGVMAVFISEPAPINER
jgi:hypothetical protein